MLTFIYLACHAQILMQRRQFTKTINVSAYKIILTHVYIQIFIRIGKNFCTDLIFIIQDTYYIYF